MGTRSYVHQPIQSFGYSIDLDANVQCQRLLGLSGSSAVWERLEAKLITLTCAELDTKEFGCIQNHTINSILLQLEDDFNNIYPENVSKEKRNHYLRQWILCVHRMHRRSKRKRIELPVDPLRCERTQSHRKLIPIVLVQVQKKRSNSNRTTSQARRIIGNNAMSSPVRQQSPIVTTLEGSVDNNSTETQASFPHLRRSLYLQTTQPVKEEGSEMMIPIIRRSTSPLPPSSPPPPFDSPVMDVISNPPARTLRSTVHRALSIFEEPSSSPILANFRNTVLEAIDNGDDPVRIFLQFCDPPMDQYHSGFVKKGCRTKRFLSVLANCLHNRRRAFLTSLGDPGYGPEPTELDVRLMDKYLKIVFGV